MKVKPLDVSVTTIKFHFKDLCYDFFFYAHIGTVLNYTCTSESLHF